MQTTITFSDGDQVTSAKLNEISTGMSFESGDISNSTLAISSGQLRVGTITSSEMGALSVATGSLIDASVTTAKIADGSVTTAKIANLAVTGAKIAAGTITFSNIASGAISGQSGMQTESSVGLVAAENVKHAPGVAKAYGEFLIETSSRSIRTRSVNITSLTRIDSTHTTVTLDTNMDSEYYTVMATFVSTGTAENASVSVYDKAAGSFKLMHPAEASGRSVNFVVFGRYA